MRDMELTRLVKYSHPNWDGLGETQEAVRVELGRRAFFEQDEDAYNAIVSDPELFRVVTYALLESLATVRLFLVEFSAPKDSDVYKARKKLDSMLSDDWLEKVNEIQQSFDKQRHDSAVSQKWGIVDVFREQMDESTTNKDDD